MARQPYPVFIQDDVTVLVQSTHGHLELLLTHPENLIDIFGIALVGQGKKPAAVADLVHNHSPKIGGAPGASQLGHQVDLAVFAHLLDVAGEALAVEDVLKDFVVVKNSAVRVIYDGVEA